MPASDIIIKFRNLITTGALRLCNGALFKMCELSLALSSCLLFKPVLGFDPVGRLFIMPDESNVQNTKKVRIERKYGCL